MPLCPHSEFQYVYIFILSFGNVLKWLMKMELINFYANIARKIINIHALCSVAHSTAPHISLMAWFVTCKMWLNRNRIVEIVHDILFERRLNWKKVHTHTHTRAIEVSNKVLYFHSHAHIFDCYLFQVAFFSEFELVYGVCVCVHVCVAFQKIILENRKPCIIFYRSL